MTEARPPEKKLLCNCRTFAVLLTSMLRYQNIPARTRGGFATYTWGRGKGENHWICEYWKDSSHRWVQVDAQLDAAQRQLMGIDFDPLDVPAGKFMAAGAAWQACRAGAIPTTSAWEGAMGGCRWAGRWFAAHWRTILRP